jgi:hypothetical protein
MFPVCHGLAFGEGAVQGKLVPEGGMFDRQLLRRALGMKPSKPRRPMMPHGKLFFSGAGAVLSDVTVVTLPVVVVAVGSVPGAVAPAGAAAFAASLVGVDPVGSVAFAAVMSAVLLGAAAF